MNVIMILVSRLFLNEKQSSHKVRNVTHKIAIQNYQTKLLRKPVTNACGYNFANLGVVSLVSAPQASQYTLE